MNIPLADFRFKDSPCKWVLTDRITKSKTLKQILEDFYLEHSDSEPPYRPLGWALDPERDGIKIYGENTNVIVVPYRRGFYFTIEKQFRAVGGPHTARLLWKASSTETFWIAIMQINEMFYSQERMQSALIEAITNRELYQSEKTQQTLINY